MNRELISKALNQTDEELIAETMIYRGRKRKTAPERTAEMTEKTKRRGNRKMLPALLAACMVFALAVTAYASNLWGIREMLGSTNRELPAAASDLIQQHNESGKAGNGNWSASITESLSDASTVMVTVTVSGGEKYIVVPTDAMPEDYVSVIGLDGGETLASYAEAQGKELLLVGASLPYEELGIAQQSQTFRSISDNEMAILIQAEKTLSAQFIDTVCNVYALEAGSENVQRVEIPFTLAEASSKKTTLIPVNPNAFPGLSFGDATVTETALGLSIEFTVKGENDAIYSIKKMGCDELTDWEGGLVLGDDGFWHAQWTMGQGNVTDALTVHIFGQNEELIGDIIFKR